jgi:hypothetical protein
MALVIGVPFHFINSHHMSIADSLFSDPAYIPALDPVISGTYGLPNESRRKHSLQRKIVPEVTHSLKADMNISLMECERASMLRVWRASQILLHLDGGKRAPQRNRGLRFGHGSVRPRRSLALMRTGSRTQTLTTCIGNPGLFAELRRPFLVL